MATFFDRFNILFKEFQRITEFPNGPAAFSRKLGLSKGKVAGWLDGRSTPDPEMLKILSKELNVSILWLIGASDDRICRLEETESGRLNARRDLDFLMQFLRYNHGENFDTVFKEYIRDIK